MTSEAAKQAAEEIGNAKGFNLYIGKADKEFIAAIIEKHCAPKWIKGPPTRAGWYVIQQYFEPTISARCNHCVREIGAQEPENPHS